MAVPSDTPAPPRDERESDTSLERYRQALAAFESNPDALLPVLIARDRLDAELRRRAERDGSPQPFDAKLYRRQLRLLLEQIGPDHPSYHDALLYEYRLSENIEQVQRYGDTETLRADRARVIEQLNSLTLSALGVPFTALAGASATPAANDTPSDQLVALDRRLRQLAFRRERALAKLPEWRTSLNASAQAWWWLLDQQFATSEQEKDLPWQVLAAALMIVNLTISIEIIRRLWGGSPDVIAIFGTVLTLLLTSSPLLKRGPDLAQWVLRRIRWLSPRFHGESMAGMAGLALVLVLLCWFSLPALGRLYNDAGFAALEAGRLTDAERLLQRAIALNPDQPVPYYTLAEVYQEGGSPEQAIAWFRKSIEHDRAFRTAYYRIGNLYNRQGDFTKAEGVLLAGLNISSTLEAPQLTLLNNYTLLSNLGWTFFAQGRFQRALETLQQAIQIEGALDESDRQMLPHYYLARVYCEFQRPADAEREIRETQRFGNPERWQYQIWNATVNDYLKAIEAGADACETIPRIQDL